jgi:hypothetical protein
VKKMKRSETIIEFAKALSAFNAEVGALSKDAENPFFKSTYLTLDKIIEETRPILQKHGLSIMQFPSGDGQTVSVTTMLLHTSGEFIESEPLIMKPAKNDPQGVGSCVSYARRYSYQAILSLNTGEDDDGNNASGKNKDGKQGQPPKTNNNNNNTPKPISDGQKKAIGAKLGELVKLYDGKQTKEQFVASLEAKPDIGKFGSVSQMSIGQASKAIGVLDGWIKKKKEQQEGQG